MEIPTKRLLLREVVEGDVAALVAYQADPRSAEFRPDVVPSDGRHRSRGQRFEREVDG